MRIRGLEQSVAGMPAAALVDEILMPGEGQIRALFMHAGAMRTMPDEARTHQAFRSLDLMVTHDVEMSPTALSADYVIASKVAFEIPVLSFLVELNSVFHQGYGFSDPFGSAQPALIDPPVGSDVIDAWRLYYRIARHLGLQLECGSMFASELVPVDMVHEPSTEDIHAFIASGSAVPLDRLALYPNGHVFDEARVHIGPRDPACADRLDLANSDMLAELAELALEDVSASQAASEEFPLLMVPKRMQNATNGSLRIDAERLCIRTNPAFLHPADLGELGLAAGDLAELRSRHGSIEVVVDADADLRRGVVAIAHGFGLHPDERQDPRRHGANVNRLTALDDGFDRYSGIPRMGAIPVSLTPLRRGAALAG
jgi:anaerobic selenocysteine-containing dehydrogenase